jgi:high-affinity iron transporter
VWHVNCCNPELGGGGGWGIFNALLGWTNSATYGSVISYNLYWVCVMVGYGLMMYRERRGPIPFLDPAMSKVASYKARSRAFILRRPYEEPAPETPAEASGAIEYAFTDKKGSGEGVSTVVKPADA